MERDATFVKVKNMFGDNFLGKEELSPFLHVLGFSNESIDKYVLVPPMSYSLQELECCCKEYILILGVQKIENTGLSIRFLRDKMGVNPNISEPCFYNQDWYLNEDFIDTVLENKWYLIKKEVFEQTRGMQPSEIVNGGISFPSALLCAYTFFANYFLNHTILWSYDFVWCSDTDHNRDRIYVGKYKDIDSVNKNGFSIHRHLSLRPCYSAIDFK